MLQEFQQAILEEVTYQHKIWIELISGMTEEQARRPVEGEWSALDLFIHTISWIENALKVARLQANPDEPDPGPNRGPAGYLHINVDQFNADMIASHCGMAKQDAIRWSQSVHDELITALEALPAERLLNGAGRYGARMWYWRPAVIHSQGHRRRIK